MISNIFIELSKINSWVTNEKPNQYIENTLSVHEQIDGVIYSVCATGKFLEYYKWNKITTRSYQEHQVKILYFLGFEFWKKKILT